MRHSLHYRCVIEWLTLGWLAAIGTTSRPCSAEIPTKDYKVILHVPDNNRACKSEVWFASRFEQFRGTERFSDSTEIVVELKEVESGLVLEVFLRTISNGARRTSAPISYEKAAECTQIVADAAEIAARMLRGQTPKPQKASQSYDYEVEIDAPEVLAACRNEGSWRKFFEMARGETRFLAPYPKRVELLFDGKPEEKIVLKAVIRGDDGQPVWGPDGRLLNDIRRSYRGPLECTQALANAAQTVSNLMTQPKSKVTPPVRPPKPREIAHSSLSLGAISYANIFHETAGLGNQVTLDVPKGPRFSVRGSMSILYPTLWNITSNDNIVHPYKYTLSSMFISSLDLCYKTRYFTPCGRANFGVAEVTGVGASINKTDFVSYMSIGPNINIGVPPLPIGNDGRFQFVVEGGYYFNLIRPAISGSFADKNLQKVTFLVAKPTYTSGSIFLGLKYTFEK